MILLITLLLKPQNKKTFTVDILKGIDKNVLSKYNIPTNYNSKDEIEYVLENSIKPKLSDITKRKTSLTNDYNRLSKEIKKKRITEDLKNKYSKLLDINRKEYGNITNDQNEIKKIKR